MLKNSCCKSLKAGGLGFEPRSKVLETPILPLNYPPTRDYLSHSCVGRPGRLVNCVLFVSLTTRDLPSFASRWSGILESNQKPQTYQVCALTDCANAR